MVRSRVVAKMADESDIAIAVGEVASLASSVQKYSGLVAYMNELEHSTSALQPSHQVQILTPSQVYIISTCIESLTLT